MEKLHDKLHIGRCIKQQVELTGMTTIGLARQLGCHRTNLYKLYEKSTIDTGLLLRISKIMRYNFFKLYEKEYEM